MMSEDFSSALQESVLAVLVYDEPWGANIAAQVTPQLFDEPGNEIAEAVLEYRRKYKKPPGDVHLADMFGRQLQRGAQQTRLQKMLRDIVVQRSSLNGEYVANQVSDLVRRQSIKAALLEASERFQQGGRDTVADTENILYEALKRRQVQLDKGVTLAEPGALRFLEKQDKTLHVPLGIEPLDRLGLAIVPQEMMLLISPKGGGKSWWCVHCGKQVFLNRGWFLHVSLEMGENLVAMRYFQSLFSGARNAEKYQTSKLRVDDLGRLLDIKPIWRSGKLDFSSDHARRQLKAKMKPWGTRLDRILIKEFPNGTLSLSGLNFYLDFLAENHKFIPTAIAVDYPDLMKFDRREYRIGLRTVFEGLRQIAKERNVAMIVPTQGQRKSLEARQVTASMVSEDISKVQTADTVLTLSSSREERRLGLARLQLEFHRSLPSDRGYIITQSYGTGQFALDALPIEERYFSSLKNLTKVDLPEEE